MLDESLLYDCLSMSNKQSNGDMRLNCVFENIVFTRYSYMFEKL